MRCYFNGYAMWTYLTTPFLLKMPGVDVVEVELKISFSIGPSWSDGMTISTGTVTETSRQSP
jgi:hypothetical protein